MKNSVLAFLLVLANGCFAQSDTAFYGKLKDYRTKKQILDATVTITGNDSIPVTVSTDEKGMYVISRKELKNNKNFILKFEKRGSYTEKTKKVELKDGTINSPITINFELDPISGCQLEIPRIYFDENKFDLRPESKVSLDGLTEVLNDNPSIVLEISGHADFRETNTHTLSEKRATIILDYLVENGIDKERLIAVAYGDTVYSVVRFNYGNFKAGDVMTKEFVSKLTDPEMTEQSKVWNRATEYKILRNDYKPVNKN